LVGPGIQKRDGLVLIIVFMVVVVVVIAMELISMRGVMLYLVMLGVLMLAGLALMIQVYPGIAIRRVVILSMELSSILSQDVLVAGRKFYL